MKISIKNTEPCLCGSGKSFKSCCKGKIVVNNCNGYGEEILSNPSRINHILQEKFKTTDFRICMYPDNSECKKPIKNAHTLQNNGVLSIIAEDDHVMVSNLFNKVREGFSTDKVSKNAATTFYGFCEYHDSVVFRDIETIPYNKQIKQNFLYAYRTLAQEHHKKQRFKRTLQACVKQNPSILLSEIFIQNYRYAELSIKDINEELSIFNDAFNCNNYDILESYVYEFNATYDFAVTTTFNPAFDLQGKLLNDLYSNNMERLKPVFVSAFPNNSKFYVILSCLKIDYITLKSYFDQIKSLNEENLKIFLNNLLPTFSENIVLSPKLWNKWTHFSKLEYEKMVTGEIGDFNKLLSNDSPYDSMEDFIKGMNIKNGNNDMFIKQKYDLFKI